MFKVFQKYYNAYGFQIKIKIVNVSHVGMTVGCVNCIGTTWLNKKIKK